MNASDNVTRESGEYINSSADPVKYLLLQSTTIVTNNNNFDGCYFADFLLLNNYFSHSDNGYYWCQIVANSHPLEPSSYAYRNKLVNENLKPTNELDNEQYYSHGPSTCNCLARVRNFIHIHKHTYMYTRTH